MRRCMSCRKRASHVVTFPKSMKSVFQLITLRSVVTSGIAMVQRLGAKLISIGFPPPPFPLFPSPSFLSLLPSPSFLTSSPSGARGTDQNIHLNQDLSYWLLPPPHTPVMIISHRICADPGEGRGQLPPFAPPLRGDATGRHRQQTIQLMAWHRHGSGTLKDPSSR